MLIDDRQSLGALLESVAAALDISEEAFESATLKYEDVGEFLAEDGSSLAALQPQIYPQGSFRLGTVTQPVGREDEFDIDLVCVLQLQKESISQRELKTRVGTRLRERHDLSRILRESRRCWTLGFPREGSEPGFHMDVLPSIPNVERPPTGLLLTDRELTRWQWSNPPAYASWFYERMSEVFLANRRALAEAARTDIEDIPDWRIRTPLQRSVQILKRHRDMYFGSKEPSLRPVSIIVTTLAAHAYGGAPDLYDALDSIIRGMPRFVENRAGTWWVANPVDDHENFADKWNEYPERRIAFFEWLEGVGRELLGVARAQSVESGLRRLEEALGGSPVKRAAASLGVSAARPSRIQIAASVDVPALGAFGHALAPEWQFPFALDGRSKVSVRASVFAKKGGVMRRPLWGLTDRSVPKGVWIKFTARTNAPEPHSIRWQVVNTGQEAIQANQPRGDFYESDGPNKYVRWETTAFRGTHWVEAFVLDHRGACIARSDRVLVRVR
ncbi:MAG: nucleotidyltransferase [Thermoanaerobaculia bacterium]|nr:MAG: nucleotidyltransferase [Thermoanaerobaculia bacterium]MBZ0102333.1 nucleotidyltransferase [Thermoanaerobaculia bacterium]